MLLNIRCEMVKVFLIHFRLLSSAQDFPKRSRFMIILLAHFWKNLF